MLCLSGSAPVLSTPESRETLVLGKDAGIPLMAFEFLHRQIVQSGEHFGGQDFMRGAPLKDAAFLEQEDVIG
jgi:hypothetical protein